MEYQDSSVTVVLVAFSVTISLLVDIWQYPVKLNYYSSINLNV